jgi:hypothetical protein
MIKSEQREVILDQIVTLQRVADTLAEVAEDMRNRTSPRRPDTSAKITPELRTAVYEAWYEDPTLTQATLAARFNVHPGRISEILHGKRT